MDQGTDDPSSPAESPTEADPTSGEIGQIQAWLLLKQRQVSHDLEAGLEELQASGGCHLADLEELASDVNVDEVIYEQFRSSSSLMEAIEKALDRIEEGTYEICEACQSPIGRERLEALPWTSLCVECKRREEQEGAS